MRSPNGKRITKSCEYCGKVVELHPYRANTFRYCSWSCRSKANPHPHSRVIKVCGYCGKSFEVHKSREHKANYCSYSCRSKSIMGEGETARFWKGGIKPKVCPVCHKEFIPPFRNPNIYCSQSCYRKARPTSIEAAIWSVLQSLRIDFETEKRFSLYLVDIYIPSKRLAVECDGDYWHLKSQERDRRKDKYLRSLGVKVLRLSETKIRSDIEGCKALILKHVS